mmetsp:Transcript_356/g.949  ORF Transcript_356/g.949 Transcript_356/m.949 type:complete len:108 (-) Transcript_356:96-419(-)
MRPFDRVPAPLSIDGFKTTARSQLTALPWSYISHRRAMVTHQPQACHGNTSATGVLAGFAALRAHVPGCPWTSRLLFVSDVHVTAVRGADIMLDQRRQSLQALVMPP